MRCDHWWLANNNMRKFWNLSNRCEFHTRRYIIVLHWNGINFAIGSIGMEENRNWESCLSATENILMAYNNWSSSWWIIGRERTNTVVSIKNSKWSISKNELNSTRLPGYRYRTYYLRFGRSRARIRVQLEAVYEGKPHRPGWTPLTRRNRFLLFDLSFKARVT